MAIPWEWELSFPFTPLSRNHRNIRRRRSDRHRLLRFMRPSPDTFQYYRIWSFLFAVTTMYRRRTTTPSIPSSQTATGHKGKCWGRSSTTFDTAVHTTTRCMATGAASVSPNESSSTITWATVPSSTKTSLLTTWCGTAGKFNIGVWTYDERSLSRPPRNTPITPKTSCYPERLNCCSQANSTDGILRCGFLISFDALFFYKFASLNFSHYSFYFPAIAYLTDAIPGDWHVSQRSW